MTLAKVNRVATLLLKIVATLVVSTYNLLNYNRSHIWILLPLVWHGPLAGYVKLRVTHAPGMPGTFSPPLRVSDPGMHHDTCVTHVPWCMPGLLTSGFLWSRWRRKRSRHSWRMCNPQFCLSGKGPIEFSACISGNTGNGDAQTPTERIK